MKPIARRSLFALTAAAPVAGVLPAVAAPAIGSALNSAPYRYYSVPFTRDAGVDTIWESFFTLEERWTTEPLVMSDAELAATLGIPAVPA